ncbi:MAG TPA: hypothetical protein P5274_01650 [Candidatus Paceibacterota bacterium]|nr:hypothetical protein [Candidatus Paceibacterota bacterium]
MIYLFYGNDEIKSRDKFDAIINSLLVKSPEASLFRLTTENFKIENLEELTKGQGLFYQKFIIACDNLLSPDKKIKENKEFENEGEEKEEKRDKIGWVELAAKSENIFIFLENNLPPKILAKLEKLAVKTQTFEKKEGELSKHGGFNIFSITDAFTAKNKNRAWALYQEALMHGISSEEILWKLIWAVNNLLLVKNTKDINKLKMKPYPLTKAKTASKTFSREELIKLSTSFVDLYHENFLGTDEFEFGLEKIILSI